MKILHVMAGAEYGGAETAFVDICTALHDAGEQVEVVTRDNSLRVPKLEAAGIKVHILPFGGKMDVFTPWRLRKIIQDFKPDIVQGWMSRGTDKIPRWSPGMGIPRYLFVSRLGSEYNLKYYKKCEYFIGVTPQICDHIIRGGFAADHVKHLNNFAEVEKIEKPINRADYDTPKSAPLLLGMGRLHPAKAFDTLIKVVAELPDAHLWIAGEGPQRAELEALILELQVWDRVKLLGWREDRAALLQACDVCAFVSRSEGFGTVFVQAWAQRTPLVVCESDGPRQFVHHGEDAMMAPIDDVQAIKECVQQVLGDMDLRARLVENGYKRYRQEFTKDICIQAYLEFYHNIRAREGL